MVAKESDYNFVAWYFVIHQSIPLINVASKSTVLQTRVAGWAAIKLEPALDKQLYRYFTPIPFTEPACTNGI